MKQLIELVAAIINVPSEELTAQSGPANLPSWDSLAHIGIIAAAEQTYQLQLTTAEILSIKTISDLLSVLEKYGVKFADDGKPA
jgi:acyl carrier protein